MPVANHKSPYAGKAPASQRTNSESLRWVCGIVLLFIGLFAAAAVLFSYFCWADDQSGLQMPAQDRSALNVTFDNPCGGLGAWIGYWLVDRAFGLFGILIPVMLILLGVRIIRQRALLLNHSILSLVFVMILGSLTLGFCFPKLALISSTGMGGDFGVSVSELLHLHIGTVGTIILLVVGWILTGVFINRNFINTVNAAGNAVVDKSEKFVEKMVHTRPVEYAADAEPDVSEVADEPHVSRPVPVRNAEPAQSHRPSEPDYSSEISRPAEIVRPAKMRRSPDAERYVEEPNPFFDEVPVGEEPAAAVPAEPQHESSDELFPEVPRTTDASARVVMGRGGLVELERPKPQPVRSASAAAGSPFVEVAISEDGTPIEPPAEQPLADEFPDSDSLFAEEPVPSQAVDELPAVQPVASPDEPSEGVVVTVEANEARLVDEQQITTESYDPLKDLVNYRKPPVSLLEDYRSDSEVTDEEIFENKTRIEETLKYFGIPIQRIRATVGPTVTLYEIVQAQGVKIAKIQGLQNDIAQSLKAESGIRIIAPIPGRGTIGIEVPNRHKQVVSMYSAIRAQRFQESKAMLPVVIGRTIQNENYVFDLAKMPHLLVAGATGMGKSVGLNAIITSLLYKMHPAQLKFVMIDPKMVEFSLYAKIERHFLAKMESEDEAIVTDPRKAVYTLNALCTEMDNRLDLCKKASVRNIAEYNEKFTSRRLNPMHGHRYLPYIVVIIDEFADLIMTAKEVEMPVTRLAQKARAVGIHLIIATQRPSVDVITGKIKANFPARIAFRVMQMIDSRTILDRPGADQLIGRGDMLISKDGELTRIQCALVDTPEVERIVEYISKQQGYASAYALPDYTPDAGEGSAGMGSEEGASAPLKYDALFAEIAREAVSSQTISTSMIQRNYEVGFNRAGRIMMQLERAGIVGRQQGAKPREILFHDSPSLEARLQELGIF